MVTNKFITIGGFSLGATSVFLYFFQDLPVHLALAFFLVMYLIIWLLLWLEKKLRDSQGQFVSRCFYFLGKNEDDYKIEYVETCYEYIEERKMEYSKKVELKSNVHNLQRYEDRFCWSSYSSDIEIQPIYSGQKVINMASKNLWNVFEIDLGERCQKGKIAKTGMKIVGLNDELGIARPFLSNKSDKKIKERKMIVKIPENLKPVNAKFEVYPSGETGKVLRSEALEYDKSIGGFSQYISYPRKGWLYAIVWEWGE